MPINPLFIRFHANLFVCVCRFQIFVVFQWRTRADFRNKLTKKTQNHLTSFNPTVSRREYIRSFPVTADGFPSVLALRGAAAKLPECP